MSKSKVVVITGVSMRASEMIATESILFAKFRAIVIIVYLLDILHKNKS